MLTLKSELRSTLEANIDVDFGYQVTLNATLTFVPGSSVEFGAVVGVDAEVAAESDVGFCC